MFDQSAGLLLVYLLIEQQHSREKNPYSLVPIIGKALANNVNYNHMLLRVSEKENKMNACNHFRRLNLSQTLRFPRSGRHQGRNH